MKPSAITSYSISVRKTPFSPVLFTLVAFILFLTALYGNDLNCFLGQPFQYFKAYQPISTPGENILNLVRSFPMFCVCLCATNWHCFLRWIAFFLEVRIEKDIHKVPFAIGKIEGEECDVFSGKWVRDASIRPLYEESECPYIQPQLTCQEHGRPDKEYQSWRWQPHGCSLPSFNATFMLERLRGKRMMFVGDSLNRGQYISLVCLLHRSIPKSAKSLKTLDSLTVFRAEDYNATIEFYWAPFLLESNSDDAVIHRVPDRIIRKNSINTHGRHWKGADIIVFNSYLWWMTGKKLKFLKGSFHEERKGIVEIETEEAYRMAMTSMVNWVQSNMDPRKTRVFFTSMSPYHEKSIEWGGEPNGNCFNETTPIEDPTYWGIGSRKGIMKLIREEFDKSKVPISFINITQLSEYRKDAHTAIYKKQWNPLTPQQLANPTSYADCVHWCLPGLQDTWNELLYTKLFYV